MDKRKLNLEGHQEILKNLDRLEIKLTSIIEFNEELGKLREKRIELVENFKQTNRIETEGFLKLKHQKESTKKQVKFDQNEFAEDKKLTIVKGGMLVKTKSFTKICDLLGDLSSYHNDVNKRISELHFLKQEKQAESEHKRLDSVLKGLQAEKDEIDGKIIEFVIKNAVEGKEELFQTISNLENENQRMQESVILLKNRIDYLKDTITGLMLENHSLKKQERRLSEVIRRSIVEKTVSFVLPKSLRLSKLSDLDEPPITQKFSSMSLEQEDMLSVDRLSTDSFNLDAAIASWHTDEVSMQRHVDRLGRELEVIEVNHMKLNLLKRYVQRHGAKVINRNTHIDPTKGMSLWHSKNF